MSFVFSETWNVTFEGLPPDTENINLGAGRIQNLKRDIRERMVIDHQWPGTSSDGKHLKLTLPSFGSDPVLDGGDACVYVKVISGNSELFYKDAAGQVVQLTTLGGVNTGSAFPSNTRLLFGTAAPPPGWTQVAGANDRVVRIVDDSSGGGSGGSWSISGVSVSTSTTTGTGLSGGIAVDSHVLTTAEIPPLTFSSDYPTFTGTLNSSGSNPSSLITGTTTHSTNTIGSGGGHNHSVTNTLGATSTSSSTSTVTADGTWRPAYLNFCLGQKT